MNAYLCLGANLEQPREQIHKACLELAALPGIRIQRASSLAKTRPWGKTDQPDFHNQVLEIETNLPPLELLEAALEIEQKLGRVRKEKWGPRLIDIDILLYGDLVINTDKLTVPHPEMHRRLFALRLLAELAPYLEHPVLHKNIETLIQEIESQGDM